MKPYVMFGCHPLFGDYVDAIHATGGYLVRVVLNVPEPNRPPGQSLQEGLDRYHRWLDAKGIPHRVAVMSLQDYSPSREESALLGFRGSKVLPLVARLQQEHGITFPPLIHPSATISPMATLEEGTFVGAGAVIASHVSIGAFSLINRGVTVGHDTQLARCVVVGPSARIASWVRLEQGCVLGIGCTVIEQLTVGAEAYVAAGAVVLRDVAAGRMVAGVPAIDKKSR